MNTTIRIAAGLVLGAALALNSALPAAASRSPEEALSVTRLSTGARTHAPLGLQFFCMKNARYCRGGGAAQIRLTGDVQRILKTVNARVNRAIRPRNDKGDVWSVNVTSGDCEDYVLTKRARLVESGLPAGALRIATARTRSGEGHAVLVVRTDKGDLVLDNRTPAIKEWNKTGLRWVAMSSADPRRWNAI